MKLERKPTKRLSYEDRQIIENMILQGSNRYELALILDVHPSTIDRELRRGGYPNYSADIAQQNVGKKK